VIGEHSSGLLAPSRYRSLWLPLVLLLSTLHFTRGLAAAQRPIDAPWQQADVGNVGLAGSASETNDGDLQINGAGSDIWGTADSFHFVYQPLDDGEIRSNQPDQDASNPFAKIGLMIRLTLDPDSPHVVLDVKPDGGIEFMTRATPGGETTFVAGGVFNGDACGLRLIRSAGVVTAVVCKLINGFVTSQTLGSVPFPTGMALAGAVVTSHDPSTLSHGMFPASPPVVSTVPPPWYPTPVGAVGLTGDAFTENGTFTVRGAGSDIWGTSDSFQLVRNFMMGDGDIIARVTSEQAANTFAKAGVVLAGTFDNPSSAAVILDVRPNGVIEFMARPTDGASMMFVAGSAASFPVWLKLKRSGDQFTGFVSSEGHNWQVVGMTTVVMRHDVSIVAGLAVTSHDTGALNTSTFDHVLVTTSVPAYGSDDVGDVGIAGELSGLGAGTVALQGGGSDIWGTADAFRYLYQNLSDDGQMAVRIDSLDNTDRFAKAGIMIRDSLDPSATHVMVDVTPSSLVEVLTRTAMGAETHWIGGLSPTSFPIWLKLTRSGTVVTAWASPDGSNWTNLTQASPDISSDALIGIAVTSHDRGVLTTATFDSISR